MHYAAVTLAAKGFSFKFVTDENTFIGLLDTKEYSVAWIISSDAYDWNQRSGDPGVEKWQNLADACEKFYMQGGGLFLFTDNEPLITHANIILERIADAQLTGNDPGNGVMNKGQGQNAGTFDAKALLSTGLNTLYEGMTISYANKLGRLKVLAKSFQDHAAILYCDCTEDWGRVVVDTGFTKLWKEWDSAGTSRYIANATVWLLGLDYRMNQKHLSKTLKGATTTQSYKRTKLTPVSPPKVSSKAADVILVLDQSGSVRDPEFESMKQFCVELVSSLGISEDGINIGVVLFSGDQRTCACVIELTGNLNELSTKLKQLQRLDHGGTNFSLGLNKAWQILEGGRKNAAKVIVFQTDGEDDSPQQTEVSMQVLRMKPSLVIFAVGVGEVRPAKLKFLVRSDQNILKCSDYTRLAEIKSALQAKIRAG